MKNTLLTDRKRIFTRTKEAQCTFEVIIPNRARFYLYLNGGAHRILPHVDDVTLSDVLFIFDPDIGHSSTKFRDYLTTDMNDQLAYCVEYGFNRPMTFIQLEAVRNALTDIVLIAVNSYSYDASIGRLYCSSEADAVVAKMLFETWR